MYRVVRFWGAPEQPAGEVEIAQVAHPVDAYRKGFRDMLRTPRPPAGYEDRHPNYGLREIEEVTDA